jgi:hypothetical protein
MKWVREIYQLEYEFIAEDIELPSWGLQCSRCVLHGYNPVRAINNNSAGSKYDSISELRIRMDQTASQLS